MRVGSGGRREGDETAEEAHFYNTNIGPIVEAMTAQVKGESGEDIHQSPPGRRETIHHSLPGKPFTPPPAGKTFTTPQQGNHSQLSGYLFEMVLFLAKCSTNVSAIFMCFEHNRNLP